MEFNTETRDDCFILHLSGKLLDETKHDDVLKHAQQQIDEGTTSFIIDLDGIDYMNSTGLSLLIRLLSRARKAGGDAFLCNVSEELSKLLVITKLNAVFQVYDSVDEAANQLSG